MAWPELLEGNKEYLDMKCLRKTRGLRSGVFLSQVFGIPLLVLLFQGQWNLRPLTLRLSPAEVLAAAAETPSKGKQLLDELVRKAKQEGELIATIQSSWSKTLVQPIADAFRKVCGLDIKVTIANVNPALNPPQAIAETQSGAPATYDAVQSDDAQTIQLVGAGGAQKIDGWEALLAEVNPLVRSGKG